MTLAGLAGGYGNIGYMGPGLALAVLGPKAAAPTALIFCFDSIFLFSIVPLLIALTDREHQSAVAARSAWWPGRSCCNPLIMSAAAGALAAALHMSSPPVAIDNMLQFLQNAAAPVALFVLGVTVALRPFGRVPWEVPGVIAIKLVLHPLIVFGLMLLFGPFRAALGGDRGADGGAAAGAQRVRHRAAVRHLGRARVGRGADRHVRLRRHADQRDVADSDRPAGVSVSARDRAATTAPGLRAWPDGGAARPRRSDACRPRAATASGRKSLSSERFAMSIAKVRLATSARRAES